MQLTYRGQPYELRTPAVTALATTETATFLGKPYRRQQYQVRQPLIVPERLTFMGQPYVRDASGQPLVRQSTTGEALLRHEPSLALVGIPAPGLHHSAF